MRLPLAALAALALLVPAALAQPSLRNERGSRAAERKTVLDANRVAMTVLNHGLSGGVGEIRGNWPAGSLDFYLGDLMLVVGARVTTEEGPQVPVVAVPRGPGNRGIPVNPTNPVEAWTWEAVPGYAATGLRLDTGQPETRPATSSAPETWPAAWPSRQSDPADPGWTGAWDGLLGKNRFVDGDEVYSHLADDAVRTGGLTYTPAPADPTRRGLGLVTRQRVVALRDAGFEDALIYVWDLVNTSPRDLPEVSAGFVAGTLMGGDGDTQDDVVGYDAARGMIYAYDFDNRGNQGQPVSYTGFVFLPTPGGGHGLGGGWHFAPSNAFPLSNPQQIWDVMRHPGVFADHPAGTSGGGQGTCAEFSGCDGDVFTYTPVFALPAGAETRVAAAVVFGATLADVQRNADALRALAAGGLRFDDALVSVSGPGDITTDGPVTVSWTSADPAARVRLDATADVGRTWSPLGVGLAASGSFAFNAAGRGPGVYRVRATATTAGRAGRAETGLITVQGAAAPLALLDAPRGTARGVVEVGYRAAGTSGGPLDVRLVAILPAGTPVVLAAGLPAQGTVAWDTRLSPNGVHRLRLEVADGGQTTVVESAALVVANPRPALDAAGTYTGVGDGAVEPRVSDPSALTGHAYRVDFEGTPERAERYTVTDETTGQTVLGPTALPAAPTEGPAFDGLRLVVASPQTAPDAAASGWTAADGQAALDVSVAANVQWRLQGRALPSDYAVAFSDAPTTESLGGIRLGPNGPVAVARLTNVSVTNTRYGRPAPFVFLAQDGSDGLFSASSALGTFRSDVVVVYDCPTPENTCAPADLVPSLLLRVPLPSSNEPLGRMPTTGDVFAISTVKAIQSGDAFRFEARLTASDGDRPAGEPLALGLPAPNPTRTAARVPFALAEAGAVRLSVLDALGREVAVLASGARAAGAHEARLDTARLAAGVYVVRLEAAGRTATRRLVVVR